MARRRDKVVTGQSKDDTKISSKAKGGNTSRSQSANANQNPITSAKKGAFRLGPGKTWLGRKKPKHSNAVVSEMPQTPSKPFGARPVTRSSKRKLLELDDDIHRPHLKKFAKRKTSSQMGEIKPDPKNSEIAQDGQDQASLETPSVLDASGAESPESSDEKIQNRTGNLLKNLLSPVYSLFKVDRHNEHSSYSQEFPRLTGTPHAPSTRAKSRSKSVHADSPEDLPDCEVNTLPVSPAEKRASVEASLNNDITERDSNDEDETSIRIAHDQGTGHMQQAEQEEMDEEEDEDEESDPYEPYEIIKSLPPLSSLVDPWRRCLLPKQKLQRKTLVLDLDETLVHTELQDQCSPASWFKMMIAGEIKFVCVGIRPHLQEFLQKCAKLFEVVIFTASMGHYANAVINRLDPKRDLVQHRLFRESCLPVFGNYLKDLSALGRDLTQTIIIDNSPQAYGFQLDNGVPIESWYDNPNDNELIKLLPFLEFLAESQDVQPIIRQRYQTYKLVEAANSQSPEPQSPEVDL